MNKFLIGLVFGIIIAGGLAIYLNNTPSTQFMKQNVIRHNIVSNVGNNESKSTASAPVNYDFYDILQDKSTTSSPNANNQNTASAGENHMKSTSSQGNGTTKFLIQAGTFRHLTLATNMQAELVLNGINSIIRHQNNGQGDLYKVLIGPFNNKDAAQKIINQLSDNHINAVLFKLNN